MANAERITRALQENLIILLCFNDDNCKIVRNVVPLTLFEGQYNEIAERVYEYIDKYKVAPKDHVADIFSDIIEKKNDKKGKVFRDILEMLYVSSENINIQYTMDNITEFIRQQRLKEGILQAADLVDSGDLDSAEDALNKSMKARLDLFNPGITFSDTSKSLKFLFDESELAFPTGIKPLDDHNLGPNRKEMWLFIALPKRGKTWSMVNLGKRAILIGRKVLHITLEMSEDKMSQRYFQSFFAIKKRETDVAKRTKFKFDKTTGELLALRRKELKKVLTFEDKDIHKTLRRKISPKVGKFTRGSRFKNLIIKQFPTGDLTVRELEAYLQALEDREGFIPDMLILDYPDLMRIPGSDHRLGLGQLYKELRGIAVKKNLALVVPTQSGRGGNKESKITDANVAEDYSKIATADCVVTYSRTDAERACGLARLFVSNGRNDIDRFMVLISQEYTIGQFVLEATAMKGSMDDYWRSVEALAEEDANEI